LALPSYKKLKKKTVPRKKNASILHQKKINIINLILNEKQYKKQLKYINEKATPNNLHKTKNPDLRQGSCIIKKFYRHRLILPNKQTLYHISLETIP
jgi:hypothetical protein